MSKIQISQDVLTEVQSRNFLGTEFNHRSDGPIPSETMFKSFENDNRKYGPPSEGKDPSKFVGIYAREI